MILEVIDQGRLEKLAVVNGSAGKDTSQSGSTSPSGTLRHCPSRTELSHIVSPGRRSHDAC
nr:MAG TPA: hypothetical protein [Caudoviricetes sp.]